MLKTISGAGKYTMVNSGFAVTTHVNTSASAMGVGEVRFNANSQSLEVYDGYVWKDVNMSHASVGLTSEAESLLDWAREKRNQEMQLEALSKSNPTIADLVEQKKNLDNKIKMVQILTKEESKIGTS